MDSDLPRRLPGACAYCTWRHQPGRVDWLTLQDSIGRISAADPGRPAPKSGSQEYGGVLGQNGVQGSWPKELLMKTARALKPIALIGLVLASQLGHAQTTFTGTKLQLPVVAVGNERYAVDLSLIDGASLTFQLDPSSVLNITAGGGTRASDPGLAGTVLSLPLIHVGNQKYSALLNLIDPVSYLFKVDPGSLKLLGSRTPAPFKNASHIVSTSFFHWFAANGGQLTGPWRPLEGRQNWEGTATWWKTQIKQVMSANIDVINVHLIPTTEERRITLFMGLKEMLDEGYDIPNVAPFLDPLITWYEKPKLDLATQAGKKEVADQYIRFYEQYFQYVNHADAAANIATIDGRPVLTTWHFLVNMVNIETMTRDDLFLPLRDRLSSKASLFGNPPYMVTTALNLPVVGFSDERVPTFEINEYYYEATHNGVTAAQVKPGYWDQNVRTPGSFVPRAGGIHYAEAWNKVHAGVNRVYIESWNEYDEGTGIYAGATTPPYIAPGSQNPSTDIWSNTNNPFEYIHTTAKGAARFNDTPALDALILFHTIPAQLHRSTTVEVSVTVRNQGDESWTGAAGFGFAQLGSDPVAFSPGVMVNDTADEIPLYGGIFRGRPVTLKAIITSPSTPGNYLTRWQMMKGGQPFGETITKTIKVL